jgi:hypothetical protein
MLREPISVAYSIKFSHHSACLYVYPRIVARQGLGNIPEPLPNNEYKQQCRIVGCVVVYAIRFLSMESHWGYQCIPLSQLVSSSVKNFPTATKSWRRRFLRNLCFIRKSWPLSLPRTSCPHFHVFLSFPSSACHLLGLFLF